MCMKYKLLLLLLLLFPDVFFATVKCVLAEPSLQTISKVWLPSDNVFRNFAFKVMIVEPSVAV